MSEIASTEDGSDQFQIAASGEHGALVTASGEIDLANAGGFRAAMSRAAESSSAVTVDMTRVEYCDSAAIRALFQAAHECALTVRISATGPLARLLTISALDEIATIEHPI